MRLYHRPRRGAAQAILAGGFQDEWGYYLTDRLWRGVWLSDRPLLAEEGLYPTSDADGDKLLVVDLEIPDAEVMQYAWLDLSRPYREFLVPAELLNRCARIRIAADPLAGGPPV